MSCNKYILLAFAIVLFTANIYGYTTKKDLPLPNNFYADIGNLCVELSWEEPDSSSNIFLGYYLYRLDRGRLFFFEEIPEMPYKDYMVIPYQYYSYYVTAFYVDGESAPTIIDSSFALAPCDRYYEGFDTDWHLTGWHQEPPDGNWMWMTGCAYLYWSPAVLNYDMSLISPPFIFGYGIWYFCGIYVYMYIDDYSTDTGEKMEIWIMHDDEEDMIFQWDLDEHDDWGVSGGTEFEYLDWMQYENEMLHLKFRSHGENTYNFNYWYIYGILSLWSIGTGALQGYVVDDNGEPIEEARVHAEVGFPEPYYYNVLTNSDGFYNIDPILREYYNIKFYAPGYSSVYLDDVRIQDDSTTCYSVFLGVPTMSITPSEIIDSIQIGTVDSTLITIENNGTGALEWESYFINFNPPDDTTWIALSDSFGIVPSEDIEDIYVTFDATDDSVNQVHTCDLIFESYPDVGTIQIPVTLTVTGYSVDDELESKMNVISTFPNPFRHSTTILFNATTRLRCAAPWQANYHKLTQISIYNIKGQLVRELKIQNLKFKIYEAVWDGKDEDGCNVAQGIYFYKCNINDKNIIGKMIKIK